jgi:hypothetical protein
MTVRKSFDQRSRSDFQKKGWLSLASTPSRRRSRNERTSVRKASGLKRYAQSPNWPRCLYYIQEDKKTRDKAIKSLASFLADDAQEPISKSDMDKLWKGIFYCTIQAALVCISHPGT